MSRGNYDRLVSKHSRELLEGTVGAIARSAKEDGVDKGARKERERIIALLQEADIYGRPVVLQRDQLIALITGETK
jgi:hypothetical protein